MKNKDGNQMEKTFQALVRGCQEHCVVKDSEGQEKCMSNSASRGTAGARGATGTGVCILAPKAQGGSQNASRRS